MSQTVTWRQEVLVLINNYRIAFLQKLLQWKLLGPSGSVGIVFLTLNTSVFDFLRLREIRYICIEQVRKCAMPKAKNLLLYYSRGVCVCVCGP